MADGYQRADGTEVAAGEGAAATAEAFLAQIRAAAASPSVQVVAMPLDAPSVPAMLGSGLDGDLGNQERRGASVVSETMRQPAADVARPPGGLLDDAALMHFADGGVTTVLADADTVPRPLGDNGLAPLPAATVSPPGGDPTDLVLPDPPTQALMERVDLLTDPVRASQTVLSALAVTWKEAPGPRRPPGDRAGPAARSPADDVAGAPSPAGGCPLPRSHATRRTSSPASPRELSQPSCWSRRPRSSRPTTRSVSAPCTATSTPTPRCWSSESDVPDRMRRNILRVRVDVVPR